MKKDPRNTAEIFEYAWTEKPLEFRRAQYKTAAEERVPSIWRMRRRPREAETPGSLSMRTPSPTEEKKGGEKTRIRAGESEEERRGTAAAAAAAEG